MANRNQEAQNWSMLKTEEKMQAHNISPAGFAHNHASANVLPREMQRIRFLVFAENWLGRRNTCSPYNN